MTLAQFVEQKANSQKNQDERENLSAQETAKSSTGSQTKSIYQRRISARGAGTLEVSYDKEEKLCPKCMTISPKDSDWTYSCPNDRCGVLGFKMGYIEHYGEDFLFMERTEAINED